MSVLSNITVFNKLYINQRASTQAMKDALLKFGKQMKLENFVPAGNMYSPAYIVASKIINSSSKKGIEQTASINKFFALANQFNLKLTCKMCIFTYNLYLITQGIIIKKLPWVSFILIFFHKFIKSFNGFFETSETFFIFLYTL